MEILQQGNRACDFDATTTAGEINFYKWLGNSWGVFYFHTKNSIPRPLTHTMIETIYLEYNIQNIKIIGLSRGGNLNNWEESTIPIITGDSLEVARQYRMALADEKDRIFYIISPKKVVEYAYSDSTSENSNGNFGIAGSKCIRVSGQSKYHKIIEMIFGI